MTQIARIAHARPDLHAAVRAGAGIRFDRRPASDRSRSSRSTRVYMRVGALPQFPVQRADVQPDLVDRRLDQRILQSLRGDSRRPPHATSCRWKASSISRSTACATRRSTPPAGWARCATRSNNRVRELNYKTIRYQGHRDLMAFLINELRLGRAARPAQGHPGERRCRSRFRTWS